METGKKFVWKGRDKEKMQKRVVQLCTLTKISSEISFLSVNWAIPEKRWELSTYIQLEFLGLLFHPWKFWTKQSYSSLKNHAKLCDTYWEWNQILCVFFFIAPENFSYLLFSPRKFHIVFLQYSFKNPSPGIANFVTSLDQTNYW